MAQMFLFVLLIAMVANCISVILGKFRLNGKTETTPLVQLNEKQQKHIQKKIKDDESVSSGNYYTA